MSDFNSSKLAKTLEKKSLSDSGIKQIDLNLSLAQDLKNSDPVKSAKFASLALESSKRIFQKEIFYPYGKAKSLLILSELQLINSNLNESSRLIEKSLKIFESIADIKGIIDCYIIKGKIQIKKAKQDDAFLIFDEAYSLAKKINYKFGIFNSHFNKANILLANGDSELAENIYKECLAFSKNLSINEKEILYKLYSNLGIINTNKGNTQAALKYFSSGLKIAEEYNNTSGKIILLLNTTSLYNFIGEYKKAKNISQKMIEVCEKSKDNINLFYAYSSIIVQSLNLGELDNAYEYAIQAENLISKSKNHIFHCHSNLNLGLVYASKNNYALAREHYHKGIKIAEEFNLINEIAEGYRRLSKISITENEIKNSIINLKESAKLLKNTGYIGKLSLIYKQIAYLYEKLTENFNAQKYHKLSDSLNNFNSNLKIKN